MCSFSVLETDYIKNKIECVFIGAPPVPLQELSEFADYGDSESGDRKNQPTFRKKKGRRGGQEEGSKRRGEEGGGTKKRRGGEKSGGNEARGASEEGRGGK